MSDAFAEAAGIDMANLAYIIIPLLVVVVCIVVAIGLVDLLNYLRTGNIHSMDFIAEIFKAIGAVIIVIVLVQFIQ